MLKDFSEREPKQGYAQRCGSSQARTFTWTTRLGGKAVCARREAGPQGPEAGQAKLLTPFADDLARRVESRSDQIVGPSPRCQKDDLGTDEYTVTYISAPETAGPGARRVSGPHQIGFFLASDVRPPLIQDYHLTALNMPSQYVTVSINQSMKLGLAPSNLKPRLAMRFVSTKL